MKKSKRLISVVLIIVTLFSVLGCSILTTSAAQRGSGDSTKVIQVWTNKTGSTPYITLGQSKGVYRWESWKGKEKTSKSYGYYDVTVKAVSKLNGTKTTVKNKNLVLDGSSLKIDLKKDTYYEIVVSQNYYKTLNKATNFLNFNLLNTNPSAFIGWKTDCIWWVKTVKNCANIK